MIWGELDSRALEWEEAAETSGLGTRRSAGHAKASLQDLSAAIGHHLHEGFHREIVKVTLPEKGLARDSLADP